MKIIEVAVAWDHVQSDVLALADGVVVGKQHVVEGSADPALAHGVWELPGRLEVLPRLSAVVTES